MESKFNKSLKLHFIYITIILTLIILLLIGIMSYQKETAWLLIGFIGTAISIVLSVLAIFVTFIDMTGQQKKLSDVTETANELKFSLNKFIEESQKFYDNAKSINAYEKKQAKDRNESSYNIMNEPTPSYNFKKKENDDNKKIDWVTTGFVGSFKVKKYDITAEEIESYAKATNIKVRIDGKKEIHFYNVNYSGEYDKGADSNKFKQLIEEQATIID
ncbi:hypothetical protein [Mammaliicoccus sciuri]|uniref:hypothetical protein n=1 Tax=Mammaliicoccus sciuri TaxID=1296 RepID=UPI003F57E7CE